MNLNSFLLNFLLTIPGIFLPIYLTVYLTLHFSFYRSIERKRERIRKNIIDRWENDYKSFTDLIDNIPVKYIRVLVKPSKKENKFFRMVQTLFLVISIILIFGAVILKSIQIPTFIQSNLYSYILIISVSIYFMVLTFASILSYSEWKFYNLLDELNKNA